MKADQNRQYVIVDTSQAWINLLDHAVFLLQKQHQEKNEEQLLEQVLIDGITQTIARLERRPCIEIVDLLPADESK